MLGVALVSWGGTAPEPEGAEKVPLKVEEAASVVGGATANIVWPGTNNYYQSYDNLRFKVEVANASEVGVFADIGFLLLTGSATIPLSDGIGTLHRRVDWPYGAKFDVVVRYAASGGGWVDFAGGNTTDTDQYLHPSVKVHTVQVHNLREPNGSFQGSWTEASVKNVVDRVNNSIPGANSNTIDGIYGQCGSMIGTLNKTQWRRLSIDTVTVNSGCTDIGAIMDSCGCGSLGSCTQLNSCIQNMATVAGQTNNASAHIYVVDTLSCNVNGLTVTEQSPGTRKMILIEDSYGPQSNEELGTRILAHELGHGVGLEHVDNEPWGASACASSLSSNRNLMCQNAGRLLQNSQLPAQCSDIMSSSVYTDKN